MSLSEKPLKNSNYEPSHQPNDAIRTHPKRKFLAVFNIGVNNAESADQTVMHCHIHLIPRKDGDVSDPVEGVRHTIPNMGNYKLQ